MKIRRAGSRPSGKGPAEWFTGNVRIDPLYGVDAPSTMAGDTVTFEPGARTAWHTHPVETVLPGDVVRFAPDEKHWHGASAETAMTHIAIQESVDGKAVDWMEQVSDEQYEARHADSQNTREGSRS